MVNYLCKFGCVALKIAEFQTQNHFCSFGSIFFVFRKGYVWRRISHVTSLVPSWKMSWVRLQEEARIIVREQIKNWIRLFFRGTLWNISFPKHFIFSFANSCQLNENSVARDYLPDRRERCATGRNHFHCRQGYWCSWHFCYRCSSPEISPKKKVLRKKHLNDRFIHSHCRIVSGQRGTAPLCGRRDILKQR